jgi:hypothetical protein
MAGKLIENMGLHICSQFLKTFVKLTLASTKSKERLMKEYLLGMNGGEFHLLSAQPVVEPVWKFDGSFMS